MMLEQQRMWKRRAYSPAKVGEDVDLDQHFQKADFLGLLHLLRSHGEASHLNPRFEARDRDEIMKCGKICCAWSGEMKTFTKESPGCKVLRDPSASIHSLYVLPSVSDLQRGEKKRNIIAQGMPGLGL